MMNEDCEIHAKLEEWLGRKVDEYWDTKFDSHELRKGDERHKPYSDWVQCYSCHEWRMLNACFNADNLPDEWFCYMPPFNDKCEIPEQHIGRGVIVIGEKRSGHVEQNKVVLQGGTPKKEMRPENLEIQMITQSEEDAKVMPEVVNNRKKPSSGTPSKPNKNSDGDLEGDERHKPDSYWVQCCSYCKWRMLNAGFNVDNIPDEWFCYMLLFNGNCEIPKQHMGRGIIMTGDKRYGHDEQNKAALQGGTPKKEMRPENLKIQMITQGEEDTKGMLEVVNKRKKPSSGTPSMAKNNNDDDLNGVSSQTEDDVPDPSQVKEAKKGACKDFQMLRE